jgi:glycosyltransferase involved in cell wall biosynthesis
MSIREKVTVYIPSKNYSQFLEQAIRSIFLQTFQNWKLILIDDGSSDSSFEVMNRFSADKRVSVHQLTGLGLPAVANFALNMAESDYFVRLDGDDYMNAHALEVLVSMMDQNLDLDFVFPDYYEVDDEGRLLSLQTRSDISNFDHYRGVPPHGACTLWRTENLRILGGYREDLKGQDGLDVWLKGNKKERFTNVPLPLFYYRRHESSLTNSKLLISKARRSLKLEAISKIQNKPKVTAIIPCRSKYDFVPNLWSIEIAGKSLLELSIEACQRSFLIDQILVLGDNEAIESHILSIQKKSLERKIHYIRRDSADTRENIPLVEALKEHVENNSEVVNGIVLIKQLQAPFVSELDINELISTLMLDESESAALVSRIDWTVLSRNRYGLQVVYERNFISTNMERFFEYRNSVMASRGTNFKRSSMWGKSTTYIEGDYLSNFIIENDSQIELAAILKNRFKNVDSK